MNFYDILEVSSSAEQDEIRHSFRRLAKKYHPDVNQDPEAPDRFRLVYMAYDILHDVTKRQIYDELQVLKSRSYSTGRQADDIRRWQNRAAREAQTYAEMPYEEFKETLLDKLGFHSAQLIAFLLFFILLCAGFVGLIAGTHYVFSATFNGAKVFGYALWFFGATFTYTGIKALWGIFDIWRNH